MPATEPFRPGPLFDRRFGEIENKDQWPGLASFQVQMGDPFTS